MVQDSLTELLAVSEQLATLKGKPVPSPKTPPERSNLHPELVKVLCCGAYAFKAEGVSLDRVQEFTESARGRGLRRKVLIFGWPNSGATWYAAPEKPGKQPKVLVIKRLERLATEEISLETFVQRCTEAARNRIERIEEIAAKKAEPVVKEEGDASQPKLKGTRKVKVVLPESKGAKATADGRTVKFTGDEMGYVIWSMEALQMLEPGTAPSLERWEARALRSCRLDAIPAKKDAARAEFDATLERITTRDRSTTASKRHLLPAWKLDAPGRWILVPDELAILRRAGMATPPRHNPNASQKAIWKRWAALGDATDVLLTIA